MNRRWIGALAIIITSLAHAQDKPNVVIMLGDNVGYGDVGAYGAGEVRGMPMPRIDEIKQFTSSAGNPAMYGLAGARQEGNGFPAVFNIEADPREENNVVGPAAWVIGPYLKLIGEYQKSLEKYPNPKAVNMTEFGR